MGDGVLAYFGWPRAHEDEAERAVRAGLAIVEAVGRLATPAGEPLAARVGIATGLVVVGDLVGEGAAREEAVVGETPNLAARLQEAAAPGAVVVADGTRRLLGEVFELRDARADPAQGLRRARARASGSLGERPAEQPLRGPAVGPAAAHGRARPGAGARARALAAGRGRRGPGGAAGRRGRHRQVAAGPGRARRGRGRGAHARSATSARPTTPARRSGRWSSSSASPPASSPPTPRRRSSTSSRRCCAQGAEDVGEAAPLIAALLGIDAGARYPAPDLTPQQRRARTLAVLVEQLLGLARRRPVLMVLEDAHWIDPTTLELLGLALDRIAGARVLMLLTSRPDSQPRLGGHPHVTRLTLNRLGRGPTEAIVARLAGGGSLPPEVLGEIAARTDGVPLFVEELTKAVLEAGHDGTGGGGAGLAARLADGPAGPGARGQGGGAGRGLHRARVRLPAPRGGLAAARAGAAGRPGPARRGRAGVRARRAAGGELHLQARAGAGRRPREPAQERSGSSCTPASRGCWRSASPDACRGRARAARPALRGGRASHKRASTTGSRPGSRRSAARRWPRRSSTFAVPWSCSTTAGVCRARPRSLESSDGARARRMMSTQGWTAPEVGARPRPALRLARAMDSSADLDAPLIGALAISHQPAASPRRRSSGSGAFLGRTTLHDPIRGFRRTHAGGATPMLGRHFADGAEHVEEGAARCMTPRQRPHAAFTGHDPPCVLCARLRPSLLAARVTPTRRCSPAGSSMQLARRSAHRHSRPCTLIVLRVPCPYARSLAAAAHGKTRRGGRGRARHPVHCSP